ncbi:MAG: glycosyltransferase [Bacteroidetes bacterium]|nr:glycosyltransferase [Bacteroidota bacterium]
MHHSFLSIIGVIQTPYHIRVLPEWLQMVHTELSTQFSDFEFVLINNHCATSEIDAAIRPLPETLRKHLFLLSLSSSVNRDNAILAGLDRANGDYALIFEFDFSKQADLITQMWEKSQEGFDIVYLRAPERHLSWAGKQLYGLFYTIMRRYSGLQLDPMAHHSRIISRRALNSLLRMRENSHYIKAIYAMVGYNTAFLPVSAPILPEPGAGLGAQFRNALVAVTSFTTFLRSVLLWIFLGSVLVAGTTIYNAVKVRFTNVDIFGDYHQTLSGWAFLVVLISIFFAITCLNLYIMSIYLSNIYTELKNRPPYIIESVKRY